MPAKKKYVEEEVPVNPFAGKTVYELRNLQADALADESEAKRYLVLLRQRSANLASTAGPEVEHEIIIAKAEWVKSVEHLQAVEKALEGEYKDISGVHKF